MAGYKDVIAQAKEFWASRNQQQKTYLMVGAGATVLLLGLLVAFLGTPNYKPLYTGLDPADAQTLAAQLDAEGIPHQTSADGKTISVPASKLDAARLQTAAHGIPHSGRMGFELFDKMSWGQTEFDEKVTYQRALEGELEKTIETLNGVESARVHLVLPTDSVFIDRQRPAKASVILKLNRDGLPRDAVVAISRLVAGAVDELQPQDVEIIDADTDRSLGLDKNGSGGGEDIDATLSQQLISTLEPVVGTDKIRATVNVAYDPGTSEDSQEKYDPTVSALLSVQRTNDQATGGSVQSGVPGTDSNVPSAKQAKSANITTSPGNTQNSSTETAQYGVNKEVIRSMEPAGRIQRISAAILVDDAVVRTVKNGKVSYTHVQRTPQQLDQIAQLAKAVIGFDAKRGDTISVENMAFDTSADADLAAPTWWEKLQKALIGYAPILRPVALLALFGLAYLLVLRPIQKQVLAPNALAEVQQQAALPPATVTEHLLPVEENTEEGQRAARLKDQTVELIRQKPINTARAMQAWLREDSL